MKNGDTMSRLIFRCWSSVCIFFVTFILKLLFTHIFFLFHNETQLVSRGIPLFYHLREISSSIQGTRSISAFFAMIP